MTRLSTATLLLLLATPSAARADSFHLLTETDPGQITNNLILSHYDTLTDLINLDFNGVSALPSLASAVSVGGLAFDGMQYLLLTETDPGQITNNLVLSRYDTLADLINLDPANTSLLPSLASAVSVRGLAFDGMQYLLLTETDPGQITNNFVLSRYDTLTDLINLDPTNTSLLPSLPSAVSAAALAFDGLQYLLLTETDPGQITNNLVLSRYDTLTDLTNLDPANTSLLPSLPGAVSARGLAWIEDQEPSAPIPEPTTLILLGSGLAIATARRPRRRR
jgi:PEP-CTERM motif